GAAARCVSFRFRLDRYPRLRCTAVSAAAPPAIASRATPTMAQFMPLPSPVPVPVLGRAFAALLVDVVSGAAAPPPAPGVVDPVGVRTPAGVLSGVVVPDTAVPVPVPVVAV